MAAGIVALMDLVVWLGAAIGRHVTKIVMADRRVIHKRGLIARHTVEGSETVGVDQDIRMRLLNYGTLSIHGTGSGLARLREVDAPLVICNAISAG